MENKDIDIQLYLAHMRNRLFSGRFDSNDKEALTHVEQAIQQLQTPFEELALNAINNAKADIEKNKFKSAAYELDLIHNFGFQNPKEWYSDYFYKGELLGYIERSENIPRLKRLIFLLAKLQLALQAL